MTGAVDTVRSLYAGFASGDVGAVLGALVNFRQHTDTAVVPAALR